MGKPVPEGQKETENGVSGWGVLFVYNMYISFTAFFHHLCTCSYFPLWKEATVFFWSCYLEENLEEQKGGMELPTHWNQIWGVDVLM